MGLSDFWKNRNSRGLNAEEASAGKEGAIFRSTRGGEAVTAPEAVLRGLAPDGGL